MRRIKFMLLSLAMFAVVGGALAFKAKYLVSYCTADPFSINNQWTCTDTRVIPSLKVSCTNPPTLSTTEGAVNVFCTTTPQAGNVCTTYCTETTSLKIDF
jgi:hypothetical protein